MKSNTNPWEEISLDDYETDIEAYPDGDMTSPDYKSQIWIPVVSE